MSDSDDFELGILVEMAMEDGPYVGDFNDWLNSEGLNSAELAPTYLPEGGYGFGSYAPESFIWLQIGVDQLEANKTPGRLMMDAMEASYRNSRLATLTTAMNISYIGQAVLSWLPKAVDSSETADDIYGFLDHASRFGLAYGWDVFANFGRTTLEEIVTAAQGVPPPSETMDYVTEWTEISNSPYINPPKYKYYPPYRSDGGGNTSWSKSWDDQKYLAATTYCIEAVGVDYMDTTSGTYGVDFTTVDPHYLLSSNEIFPTVPNVKRWGFTQTSHTLDDGVFRIGWGDDSPGSRLTRLMMTRFTARAGNYYGTFTNPDIMANSLGALSNSPSTNLSSWDPNDSRLGTHKWEKDAMELSIQKMCNRIQGGYETIDLPKKLLNKVQKRGRIPDGVVSAFGYVPADDDAYRTMVAGTQGMAEGLTDALKINIGDVQYGTDAYDPDSAISYTLNPTPWTYVETVDGEQVTRSVTWEEYVAAGEGSSSGFDPGSFGGGSSGGGGVY